MAKHRLSCNKCGHTWQVSSKELAGGLVSCPGCQVVGTAAPKSDCSPKEEGYFKITERESPQKRRWKSPQGEQNGNYSWLIPIVLGVWFFLKTDSGCRQTFISFVKGESQQGVEATASSGNNSTTRPKQEPATSPAVQASAEQKKEELAELTAKRIILEHFRNMSRAIDVLGEIRAGFSVGISRYEFNRLRREFASEIIRNEESFAFLTNHKHMLATEINIAGSMCEMLDFFWERMLKGQAPINESDSGQIMEQHDARFMMVTDKLRGGLEMWPSCKPAIFWGQNSIGSECWVLSTEMALPYMMKDTGEYLRNVTQHYKAGLQMLEN